MKRELTVFALRLIRWGYTLHYGLAHHECAVTGWDPKGRINMIGVFKWVGPVWSPVKIYLINDKVDWSGDKFSHEIPDDFSPEC